MDGGLPGAEPPLFADDLPVPISTGPPVIGAARAFIQRDCWIPTRFPQGLAPEYHYDDERGTVIHNITTEDPESGRLEYLVGSQAWSIVNAFDTPTAFLHLAFSAYAARQEKPWSKDMRIKGSDLIAALGLGHRKDLSKAEKLGRIVHQARLLSSLSVRLDWTHPSNKRFFVSLSRVWEISFFLTGQKQLAPAEGPPADLIPDEVILTVRPGEWAKYFLNRDGLKEGSSLFWISYLAASVLKFDPYQEPIASKLAVLLTLTLGVRNARRRVRPLIDFAFPAEERAAAEGGGRRQRYAIKQAFDNALFALDKEGWRITFPEASYPVTLAPAWARPDGSAPPGRLPRGYWPAFLEAVLEIEPPGDIPQRLAANRGLSQVRSKRPGIRTPKLTGVEIRQARMAAGMTQKMLGEILGKSRAWLAMIEAGKRSPTSADMARLRAVFKKSGEEQP